MRRFCLIDVHYYRPQVVSFKRAGYALGPYPLFILLAVSGAFVPLLFLAVGAIVAATGGFVPESTTFSVKRKFFVRRQPHKQQQQQHGRHLPAGST